MQDSARIESIVREHIDTIWRTARRLGVRESDADDVVQEVLVVVVRRSGDIEPSRERAFVVATAARVAANYRRGRRRRAEDLTQSVDLLQPLELARAEVCAATQEASLERSRKLGLLERALSEMTEGQRVAFTLFELEQLTAREISRELGLPEAAIVSRVRRAREVLRRCCTRADRAEARTDLARRGAGS